MSGIAETGRPERFKITTEQFNQLFPYRCPLCDKPLMFEISIKAHLSLDHSWRERAAAWLARRGRR